MTATFDQWLEAGRAAGWVGGEFCGAHDMPPRTEEEKAAAAAAGRDLIDVCAPSVRLHPEGQR